MQKIDMKNEFAFNSEFIDKFDKYYCIVLTKVVILSECLIFQFIII